MAEPQVEEVHVEDVSSEDDLPDLEPTGQPAEGEPSVPKSKQSRSEKKSRKVVQKLGLKPVPGVIRLSCKKGKSVRILLSETFLVSFSCTTSLLNFYSGCVCRQ